VGKSDDKESTQLLARENFGVVVCQRLYWSGGLVSRPADIVIAFAISLSADLSSNERIGYSAKGHHS
jgi:hypothetical protein